MEKRQCEDLCGECSQRKEQLQSWKEHGGQKKEGRERVVCGALSGVCAIQCLPEGQKRDATSLMASFQPGRTYDVTYAHVV